MTSFFETRKPRVGHSKRTSGKTPIAARLAAGVCLFALVAGHAEAELGSFGVADRVSVSASVEAPRDAMLDAATLSAFEPQQLPQSPPRADEAAKTAIDMESVRARALLGLGDVDAARRSAEVILKDRPNDVSALGVLALADETDDRWRQAAQRWHRIESINGDPAAAARSKALIAAHPSQVMATAFFEGSASVDEQYGARAMGAWRPLDGPEWIAQVESRHAEADAIIGLNGTVRPVSLTRERVDIGVADTTSLGRLSATLTAAENGVGLRASYGKKLKWGGVEAFAGVNDSYWMFSAGIANEARSDFVGLSASAYQKYFGARASVRRSVYGVKDDRNIAESTRVTVGIDVPFSQDANALRLSYVMDGEYFDKIDLRTTGGVTYAPMPFATREVHSLGAFKDFGDKSRTYVSIGAGYRLDRYGSSGGFASVSGEVAVAEKVRVGLRAEYSETSIRGLNEGSYSFGEAYVRRIF